MIRTIADFLGAWKHESEATLNMLRSLTDESLAQRVTAEGRSLGTLAWHVALAPVEMMRHAGLPIEGPPDNAPPPPHASEIAGLYEKASSDVASLVPSSWSDEQLTGQIPMYGQNWTRGFVLSALIGHQTHHRGQMTVLMRQAGLRVPGVYGPAKEEWAAYGMPPQD